MAQLTGYPFDTRVRRPAVTQTVRLDALRQVGLFNGVSKRSLILVDRLSTLRTVPAGEAIVTQGDSGSDMMIVLHGSAAVTRGTRKVGTLGPGQVFGEMSLLDNQPRSATVTALEPTQMLVVHGPAFRKLLTKVPGLTDAVLATLCQRLRDAHAAADV